MGSQVCSVHMCAWAVGCVHGRCCRCFSSTIVFDSICTLCVSYVTVARTASTSCALIKTHFSQTTTTYYIDPDSTADDTSNAGIRFCQMSTGGTDGGGDGLSESGAALSCLHLFTFFNDKTSGIRWVRLASVVQVFCDQSGQYIT